MITVDYAFCFNIVDSVYWILTYTNCIWYLFFFVILGNLLEISILTSKSQLHFLAVCLIALVLRHFVWCWKDVYLVSLKMSGYTISSCLIEGLIWRGIRYLGIFSPRTNNTGIKICSISWLIRYRIRRDKDY